MAFVKFNSKTLTQNTSDKPARHFKPSVDKKRNITETNTKEIKTKQNKTKPFSMPVLMKEKHLVKPSKGPSNMAE